MKEINKIKMLLQNYFSKRANVECTYLFGSYAKGKVSRYSDIDIAILFDDSVPEANYTDEQIKFVKELSELLGAQVDVVILNKAPAFLRFRVLRESDRVYEGPRKGRAFEARSIVEYFDFKPVKDFLEDSLIRRLKEA